VGTVVLRPLARLLSTGQVLGVDREVCVVKALAELRVRQGQPGQVAAGFEPADGRRIEPQARSDLVWLWAHRLSTPPDAIGVPAGWCPA
jgi:hypothetical protein